MLETSEIMEMITAASNALSKLKGKRSTKETKVNLIRSLYASINSARTRGVGYDAIAKGIKESTGVTITGTTLKIYFESLKDEAAAAKISRNIAEMRRAGK